MNAVSENNLTVNRDVEPASILKRIAAGEKAAVEDCVNLYGDAVWKLAKKSADTVEDAEEITLDIFGEIWKRAGDLDADDCNEIDLIASIIRRRLSSYRQEHLMCDA